MRLMETRGFGREKIKSVRVQDRLADFVGTMLSFPRLRSSAQVARILAGVDDLPASARLLPALQRLLRDHRASTADVVDLMRLDATMTARVIALANRAHCGAGRRCGSLDDAVFTLGFEEVYRLIATVAVQGIFSQEMPVYGLEEGELLEQSLSVAVVLPQLGREASLAIRGDELFTVGLLHALGKLALSLHARETKVRETLPAGPIERLRQAEKRLFGTTTPEVSAALLEKWQFTPALVVPIRYQWEPERAGNDALGARLLRHAVELSPTVRDASVPLPEETIESLAGLGLETERLPILIGRSQEIFEALSHA